MAFWYWAFFDIFFGTNPYKKWRRVLNSWNFGTELFWTFSWKNPYKHDIGCWIHGILVSSFLLAFAWTHPYKHEIGGLIHGILVASFLLAFAWKIHIKWCRRLNPWHFVIELFLIFFMENPYKDDIGCLIYDIWVSSLFWHFNGKNPDKNDIGCLIREIWVSSFFDIFMENPDQDDIGCLIHDIWVSSFFWHFHGKIDIKMTSDA